MIVVIVETQNPVTALNGANNKRYVSRTSNQDEETQNYLVGISILQIKACLQNEYDLL